MIDREVVLYDQSGKVVVGDKRNLAFSKMLLNQMPKAEWPKWTVEKAVKHGLKSSVWIYRSFTLICGSASGVPLRVVDKSDGEPIDKHALNQVLQVPNNQISRKVTFGLIYSWLMLAGQAYFIKGKKSVSGSKVFPLWPASPDRIAPIRSKEIEMMIEGYAKVEDKNKGKASITWQPEEVIAFRNVDPSNPLLGVSPLFAAARVIDTDSEQQNFNKAAMQNRGVLEGLIAFEMPLTQDQLDAQSEAWNQKNSGSDNARKTAFLGNKAEYHRLSMTPTEADFTETRKSNRDEILAATGTPSQLVNAQESSTYDNFRTSEIIHWRNAIVPLIDIVVDGLNFHFTIVDKMLGENETIAPDYSNVQALQQNFKEKTIAAEKLFKIGVPVMTISAMLKLGIDEYEGWDMPFNGKDVKINPATGQTTTIEKPTTEGKVDETKASRQRVNIKPWETRQEELTGEAKKREDIAKKRAKSFGKILSAEQDVIDDVLASDHPLQTLLLMFNEADPFETAADWERELRAAAIESGLASGKGIIIEQRGFEDDLANEIDLALQNEGIILQERSLIAQTTADLIISQVADGLDEGMSIQSIKQALTDTGVFSPERALRISRTITGTASSIGQLSAGVMSGAQKKRWVTAGFGVRDLHQERDGETVNINARFERVASPNNGVFPRYPLDPEIDPGDRINCRCSMVFE